MTSSVPIPLRACTAMLSPPPTRSGANQAIAPMVPPIAPARNLRGHAPEHADRGEQRAVIENAEQPGGAAKQDAEWHGFRWRRGQGGDREDRNIWQEQMRHRDRGGGGPERRDRDPRIEPSDQFLEHEDRPGDRRIEGCGKTSSGAGGEQRAAIGPGAAKDLADEMGDRRAHLHARTFAAEREPGTDREDPSEELDRNEKDRSLRKQAAQHGLHMGNAAPPGMK